MSARAAEQRDGAVCLAANEIRVRAGFRVVTDELLAGGPVELEFFAESQGTVPLRLAVGGDRGRQRPGQVSFAARFEGAVIDDPLAAVPYLGGPLGVVEVSADTPWRQPLVLNEFVRLERTLEQLADGGVGRLDLACQRPLALAATDVAALANEAPATVAVQLTFDLRRQDAALAQLSAQLLDEVMHGPPSMRERPLTLLLSMRSVARAQIDALCRHPDPSVSNRARSRLYS